MSRLTAIVLMWLTLLLVAACSRHEAEPAPCPSAVAGNPVDPKLLAFLSRARAAHHSADRHEEQELLPPAIQVLNALIDGPIPSAAAPEVREVLADTRARLADLESRQNDFASAEQHLERGLGLVPEQSYFRGHLFEVRGLTLERQAKQLRAEGNEGRARELEQRALEAFETSMKIQAAVIDANVGDDSP